MSSAQDIDDDYNPCGEEYDHDLNLIGEDGEYRTYECRTCGAEIDEEKRPTTEEST